MSPSCLIEHTRPGRYYGEKRPFLFAEVHPFYFTAYSSNLCKKLDPIVEEWKNRSLAGQVYPFLLVDAIVLKIRENRRVRSHSVLIAIGINEEGHREILGIKIGDCESEDSWTEFFNSLKAWGLSGVDLVVSDDHRGCKGHTDLFQGVSMAKVPNSFYKEHTGQMPEGITG